MARGALEDVVLRILQQCADQNWNCTMLKDNDRDYDNVTWQDIDFAQPTTFECLAAEDAKMNVV